MKKSILVILISLFTVGSFAQQNNTSEDFQSKAFEILLKNSKKIRLSGDIKKGEKLFPILRDLQEQLVDLLFSGDDVSSVKKNNRIHDAKMICELYPRGIAAKCTLFIQYLPLGETAITFVAGLDKNKMPESIMENRAEITRGN